MTVYEYKLGEKLPISDCAVAIGFFDGVHLAHRELISEAVTEAARLGIKSGVVTFDASSGIKSSTPRIYSGEDRLALFESLGIDIVVVCDFAQIADMSGEEFVRDTLVGDIGARSVVAGYNFRFGKGASSDADALCEYMASAGGRAIIKEPYLFRGAPLSSTVIRNYLTEGDMESANTALGAPYFITGGVCRGRGVGKKLGFPTLNLPYPRGRVKLKQGVYRCAVLARDEIYNAVTNVGVCPTFDLKESVIEAHLIDFSGDLYGREVKIYFLGYLREERKFDSPEALTEQIATDTKRTIEENGEKTWQEFGLN